nr:FMN-dependent NADH-azoreductase [Haemophilus haemolyticus]
MMIDKDKKSHVTIQLAQMIEQLEMAKEMWLEDDEMACLKLLQAASREMKCVVWKIVPILE